MKKKFLALFAVFALMLNGCAYSLTITMPDTVQEGIENKNSDIVGVWYYSSDEYNGLIYFFSNNTGELLLLNQNKKQSTLYNFTYSYNADTGLFTMKRDNNIVASMNFSLSKDKTTITSVYDGNKTEIYKRVD